MEEFIVKRQTDHRKREVAPGYVATLTEEKQIAMMKSRICQYHNIEYVEQVAK